MAVDVVVLEFAIGELVLCRRDTSFVSAKEAYNLRVNDEVKVVT